MGLVASSEPSFVARAVTHALHSDPVRNTIFGAVQASLGRPLADGWSARDGAAVAARGQRTTPIAVTDGWADVAALATVIAELSGVIGVGGPVAVVESLVAALGWAPSSRMEERLFRLDDLVPLVGIPGSARRGGVNDIEVLTEWYTAFVLEAFGALPPHFDGRKGVERGIANGGPWLWETADGAPAAMAVRHPVVHGVARLGPVYTLPALRGHGFGSAVTAAAARDVLRNAATPVLYTDRANPTSNKIYQAIGFRPVDDRLAVTFA